MNCPTFLFKAQSLVLFKTLKLISLFSLKAYSRIVMKLSFLNINVFMQIIFLFGKEMNVVSQFNSFNSEFYIQRQHNVLKH